MATSSSLLTKILYAVGASGLFTAGFAAGRVTAGPAGAAPAAPASVGYVKRPPGTYPPPPASYNACYAAGTKTASLPCLPLLDPQLPMLLGQCNHPASNITEGPTTSQYAGSPAVLCCYKADTPTCSGRPLVVGGVPRVAALRRGGWHEDVTGERGRETL